MSKKFRGQRCAYCVQRSSTTGDHVFAREFFLEHQRNDLPKVPACETCNNLKSRLEHYLVTVLPFGGQYQDAADMLQSRVPGRLARNSKLKRQLAIGIRSEQVVDATGQSLTRTTVPFDGDKLEQLFGLIVRGLIHHHWGIYLPGDYVVDAAAMREPGQVLWENLRAHQEVKHRVARDLGQGTVRYEGIQSGRDPSFTAWQFRLYGHAMLGGDSTLPGEVATMIIGRSFSKSASGATSAKSSGVNTP